MMHIFFFLDVYVTANCLSHADWWQTRHADWLIIDKLIDSISNDSIAYHLLTDMVTDSLYYYKVLTDPISQLDSYLSHTGSLVLYILCHSLGRALSLT